MAARRPETLVLRLPPDPGLAGLARLVALHFLRQNGLRTGPSRAGAGRIERAWRAAARRPRSVRGAAASGSDSLIFVAGALALQVLWRRPGGWKRVLASFDRPTAH